MGGAGRAVGGLGTIAARRIARQRLHGARFDTPGSAVRWFGAVQSQDYPMACWSVAQRLQAPSVAALASAMADGSILRTHVLRPTWHFVARDDLRWLLALTGPRVVAKLKPYDTRGGLDSDTVARGVKAIASALRKGGSLSKNELASALGRRLPLSGWALGHVLMHAELAGIVCSGAPSGARQTYALLEERAPGGSPFTGDDGLAELARRYFQSHAPATARDFGWWSGLTAAQVKRGIAALGSALREVRVGDLTFFDWAAADLVADDGTGAHLLQPFDELVVAYTESRHVLDLAGVVRHRKPEGLLSRGLLVDGQIAGRWSREVTRTGLTMTCQLAIPETGRVRRLVSAAAERFAAYHGFPGVSVVFDRL